MILEILEIYIMYLIASIFLRFVMNILPEPFSRVFNTFASSLRRKMIAITEKIFSSPNNFEVYFTSRFVIPFLTAYAAMIGIQILILIFEQYVFTKVFLNLLYLYFIVNTIPSAEEMDVYQDVTQSSIFAFIVKLVILVMIIIYTKQEAYILMLIIPVTSINIPRFRRDVEDKYIEILGK